MSAENLAHCVTLARTKCLLRLAAFYSCNEDVSPCWPASTGHHDTLEHSPLPSAAIGCGPGGIRRPGQGAEGGRGTAGGADNSSSSDHPMWAGWFPDRAAVSGQVKAEDSWWVRHKLAVPTPNTKLKDLASWDRAAGVWRLR
eukprot:SAG22_NODE_5316_length_1039_cov_1.091489_2_plen_142_part_00